MKLRVLGLTVMKFVGEMTTGHNCDFTQEPQEQEKYILHCINDDHTCISFDITLEECYGECGSGWCTASWGYMTMKNTTNSAKMPWTHKIKEKVIIDMNKDDEEISNIVFKYSECGGDEYYPTGYVDINMELFEELPRAKKERPVYIFVGPSGIGKSTLGYFLSDDLEIFETDSIDELPNLITADVVIVGNRKEFEINDIIDRLFNNPEVIIVDFRKENNNEI